MIDGYTSAPAMASEVNCCALKYFAAVIASASGRKLMNASDSALRIA